MIFKIILTISWMIAVQAAPRQKRLTVAEKMPSYYYNNINGNPEAYSFGYDVSDPATGNIQFRSEQRYPNGTVAGNYGYIDPAGNPRRYRYIADVNGYRVYPDYSTRPPIPISMMTSSNIEPSITWTRPPKRPNKNTSTRLNEYVSKLGMLFNKSLLTNNKL